MPFSRSEADLGVGMYVHGVSGDTTVKMLTVVHYVVILEDLHYSLLHKYSKLGIP